MEDCVSDKEDPEETKRLDTEYYQAIKNGGPIPDVVVEPDRFVRYYEQKYGKDGNNPTDDTDDEDLKEDVNISINGSEADEFIQLGAFYFYINTRPIQSMT